MSSLSEFATPGVALTALYRCFEYDPEHGGFVGHFGVKKLRIYRWQLQGLGLPVNTRGVGTVGLVDEMVWLWHHQVMPPAHLRRINGIQSDCRIENLGMILKKGYVEGFADQWTVYAHHKKRDEPLGSYPSWQAACAAYDVGDLV